MKRYNSNFTFVCGFVIVFLISCIPLLDLCHDGLPVTHDGQDHVARIANFYQSLSEGNIIPRWAGNLNWGYGHPILMFLYPLPSYIASVFRFFTFSFVESTKLVFAVSYIVSMLGMYVFASSLWGYIPGMIAAVLYGFAPYRFVDLYVRGAIGEHVAFVFPPIILFLIKLYSDTWKLNIHSPHHPRIKRIHFIGIVLSATIAALILSHNAISIMFMPIFVFYAIYVWKYETHASKRFILAIMYHFILGLLLSTFFWLPAFVEGKYTLRDIVTRGEFGSRFVSLKHFIIMPWSYGGEKELTKEIGIVHWISIVFVTVVSVFKKEHGKGVLYIGVLIIFFLSLFLMTSYSLPIWNAVSILQKFQFPWRFLSVSLFVSSFCGGYAIYCIQNRKIQYFVACCFFILSIFITRNMWHAKEYRTYDESFFTGVYYSTTDTGESSPIWSVRFMERKPSAFSEVIEGDSHILPLEKTSTSRHYYVYTSTKTRIVENTIYFPGWNVYVDNKPVDIQFQDPNWRGLITYWLDEGNHNVRILFEDTKLRKVSHMLTLAGFLCLWFPIITMIHFYDSKKTKCTIKK